MKKSVSKKGTCQIGWRIPTDIIAAVKAAAKAEGLCSFLSLEWDRNPKLWRTPNDQIEGTETLSPWERFGKDLNQLMAATGIRTAIDISNADFSADRAMRLSNSRFRRLTGLNTSVAGSTINSVEFSLADFSSPSFKETHMTNVTAVGGWFEYCQFSDAVHSSNYERDGHLKYHSASIWLTNFVNGNLSHPDFSYVVASDSDFRNANFGDAECCGASFSSCHFKDANFEGAYLANVDFSSARGDDGSTHSKCAVAPGAKRLFARRIIELTLILAVRCRTGSSPARARKSRFHFWTIAGVRSRKRTA